MSVDNMVVTVANVNSTQCIADVTCTATCPVGTPDGTEIEMGLTLAWSPFSNERGTAQTAGTVAKFTKQSVSFGRYHVTSDMAGEQTQFWPDGTLDATDPYWHNDGL